MTTLLTTLASTSAQNVMEPCDEARRNLSEHLAEGYGCGEPSVIPHLYQDCVARYQETTRMLEENVKSVCSDAARLRNEDEKERRRRYDVNGPFRGYSDPRAPRVARRPTVNLWHDSGWTPSHPKPYDWIFDARVPIQARDKLEVLYGIQEELIEKVKKPNTSERLTEILAILRDVGAATANALEGTNSGEWPEGLDVLMRYQYLGWTEDKILAIVRQYGLQDLSSQYKPGYYVSPLTCH